MAIYWTGTQHDTPGAANFSRDYDRIAQSARIARDGVLSSSFQLLAEGVDLYHATQLAEGMDPLPDIAGSISRKYSGGGHGGYALYLFDTPAQRDAAVSSISQLTAIEPFSRV
jgi:hypothetical protein